MPRPDPLTDPLNVARGAIATPPASDAAPRPAGRRVAAPAERQADGPYASSVTETGSHARILEPLLEEAPPKSPAKPPAKPSVKPSVKAREKPAPAPTRRQKKAEAAKASEAAKSAKAVETAKSAEPEPSRFRRRTEARPKVEKPAARNEARDEARAAARAARAATAAPAAKEAVRAAAASASTTTSTAVNPASLRPAAARRLQAAERIGAGPSPALTDNESWILVLLLGAAAVAVARLMPDLPDVIRYVGGAMVSCALSWGLAVRTGGRPIWATGLTATLAAAAIVTQWPALLSGAAIGTAVLAATLAFMATRPAATFAIAIREVLIATAVSWVGALGVVGYGEDGDLDVDRFGYVVFALSLAAAFVLVYRLGAGLHGLGRRGYAVAGGTMLILLLAMAYTEAISQYGSREIVDLLDSARDSTRSALGAVPHPIMAMIGYPALVWGVFMRARRRQGWWVCAFGVAATAPSASRLVAADLSVQSIVLGAVYSLVIGLAIGYLVIRLEQSFTGSHGRRARRDEEAEAHRPEPMRSRPLH